MEREEVKARVDELLRQRNAGEIDQDSYVDGIAKLQIDAGNENA